MGIKQFSPIALDTYGSLCRLIDGGGRHGGLACVIDAASVPDFSVKRARRTPSQPGAEVD